MPALTDVALAIFVALLVLGGIYVPRLGDALGRRLRGDPGQDRRDGTPPGPPPPGR